jgi:hypothetical protein
MCHGNYYLNRSFDCFHYLILWHTKQFVVNVVGFQIPVKMSAQFTRLFSRKNAVMNQATRDQQG